ncbi:ImmA/IrrE family metallo-endopeptidase [Nesterenkonia lacusekhoensis]|uniref:Zn-dependent peptidase ImmA (M78 family) n=1 Tax=Nesterenkonia lacusekhoensis TaxID=150832 RepID=A0ABS4T6P3_9MICC|nr:ImmA/IrrE family metallo-endopeptidase [Nesterenkonia lacusekhoensis]MBP2319614.1 Zn-dependent peptidase ImmA (M78 family) [Nesterenkonia lacusekhoensis]
MADLEGIAHRMGVRVEHRTSLRRGRWGEYDHRHREIRLLTGLGPVQYRSTLAHELGHAHHGHWWTSLRHEDQADTYAAWLLISPAEWTLATAIYPDCPQSVAAELGVLPRLVEIYAGTISPVTR